MLYKDFLQNLDKCPFCDNGNGRHILKTDTAYLTYALAPYHKHHLLVVPFRHEEIILGLSEKEILDMDFLQEEALKIFKKLGYKNMSVLEREGDNTSKSIPHLHNHVIPEVRIGDLDHNGNERAVMSDSEIEDVLREISAVL